MADLAKEIIPVNLEDEMRKSYLDYAMSVIVGRALPDVRERMLALGAEPGSGTPDDFAAYMKSEIVKWGKVIKAAGIERVQFGGQGQTQPLGRADEPVVLACKAHAGTRRMVATSSATVMPNLENCERFMMVPLSIRYIQSTTSRTCPPASSSSLMR